MIAAAKFSRRRARTDQNEVERWHADLIKERRQLRKILREQLFTLVCGLLILGLGVALWVRGSDWLSLSILLGIGVLPTVLPIRPIWRAKRNLRIIRQKLFLSPD